MTPQEWEALSYVTFGEWWDAPQSSDRMNAWFPMLEKFSVDEVHGALQRLLRSSPTFAPRLGDLMNELEPAAPTFDEIWPRVFRVLGRVSPTYHGEDRAVAAIRDACGEETAGWVALFGAKRLSLLDVSSDQGGQIELARLKKSYEEQVGDVRQLERGAAAVRVLLGDGSRRQIKGGDDG